MGIKQLTKVIGDAAPDAIKVMLESPCFPSANAVVLGLMLFFNSICDENPCKIGVK